MTRPSGFSHLFENGEAVGDAHGEPIIRVVHFFETTAATAAWEGAMGGDEEMGEGGLREER